MYQILVPGSCKCYLTWEKSLFRYDFEMGDFWDYWGEPKCSHKYLYKRETGDATHQEEKACDRGTDWNDIVKTDDSHQKLEKTRSPWSLYGEYSPANILTLDS
jgi:hypothetical protein